MNAKDFIFYISPRTLKFRTTRSGLARPGTPITLTYSVTAAYQSRCKTCNIGLKWQDDPKRSESDLKIEEIEKIFETLGHIYFFNISGGEPFLRKDLPEIIKLACRHLKPRIIQRSVLIIDMYNWLVLHRGYCNTSLSINIRLSGQLSIVG